MISVIVPVYKVESYLNRCVQSIVDQTYTNLEIILVDDGSPDNCPAICDAWAERDNRIKVIHKPNGGLSDARNAGMAAATGEYIAFVDSDDWINPEMYEKLLDRMVLTGSDIVSCDAIRIWDDCTQNRTMIHVKGDFVMDRTDAMRAFIRSTCLMQPVWNKLYKASQIKSIPFEKGKVHEDEFWSWRVVALASRVATVEGAYYYYYQRTDSIMGRGYSGFPLMVVEAKLERHDYIIKSMPELKDLESDDLLNTCFFQGVQVMRYEKGNIKDEYMSELQRISSKCDFSETYLSGVGIKKRAKLWLMKRHIKLACILAIAYGVK